MLMLRILNKCGLPAVLLGVCVLVSDAAGEDDGFQVELSLENGHLGQVIFGVSPQASAGFDRQFDSPAPPPGHGTGYTAFLLEEADMFLYRDIKPPAARLTWTFLGRVHPDKPIRISWQSDALPEGYEMRIRHPDQEQPLDMRKTTAVTLQDTEKLQIVATAKNHADPAKETVPP